MAGGLQHNAVSDNDTARQRDGTSARQGGQGTGSAVAVAPHGKARRPAVANQDGAVMANHAWQCVSAHLSQATPRLRAMVTTHTQPGNRSKRRHEF